MMTDFSMKQYDTRPTYERTCLRDGVAVNLSGAVCRVLVRRTGFEPIIVNGKARRGITYKPDFVLWYDLGPPACIEIKGYARNASINRFKMAVDKFPHLHFEMLTRENGQWKRIL
jgi:hypothetical protein